MKLHEPDFVLSNYNDYYFLHNIPMEIDPNVSIFKNEKQKIFLDNNKKVQKAIWLDTHEEIKIEFEDCKPYITKDTFKYGNDLIVRVAKITYK